MPGKCVAAGKERPKLVQRLLEIFQIARTFCTTLTEFHLFWSLDLVFADLESRRETTCCNTCAVIPGTRTVPSARSRCFVVRGGLPTAAHSQVRPQARSRWRPATCTAFERRLWTRKAAIDAPLATRALLRAFQRSSSDAGPATAKAQAAAGRPPKWP